MYHCSSARRGRATPLFRTMSSLGITHDLMTENWLGLGLAGRSTPVWRRSRSLVELEPREEREVLSQLSGWGRAGGGDVHIRKKK